MALSEHKLPLAQQENLLSMLALSDEHGKLIAQIVTPDLFEGDYREIAERSVAFWRSQGEAPKTHLSDLFSDILEDEKNRKASVYRRIITSMFQLNDDGINSRYVIECLEKFIRLQKLKQAIYFAAEIVNRPGETSIEQTEEVLQNILMARDFRFNPGMRLTEIDRMLEFLQLQHSEFSTGIDVLDRAQIIPMRGKLLLLAAPSGYGKTWALVNVGKHGLLNKKRVLHMTGELDEEDVSQRYYQALFAVPTRYDQEEPVETARLRINRDGDLVGIDREEVKTDFTFDSEHISDELQTRISIMGDQFFSKLIVKRFPSQNWTVGDYNGYLDSLEATEGYSPDLVLFDSPYHLKTNTQSYRFSLVENIEGVRSIARTRNHAVVATHQISDEGLRSGNSRGSHLSEAKAIKWVCDNLLTYSSTDIERRLGLGRLYVDKARKASDHWGLIITQNLRIGQFCLSSTRLSPRYFDIRKRLEDEEYEQDVAEKEPEDRRRGGFADDDD
jgi:HEPN domain-containing protein